MGQICSFDTTSSDQRALPPKEDSENEECISFSDVEPKAECTGDNSTPSALEDPKPVVNDDPKSETEGDTELKGEAEVESPLVLPPPPPPTESNEEKNRPEILDANKASEWAGTNNGLAPIAGFPSPQMGREGSLRNVFGYDHLRTVHTSDGNPGTENAYALLTLADADQFHASWSNTTEDDLLGFSSSFAFRSNAQKSANLIAERPVPISRMSSSQSRVSSIGENNGVSSVIHDAARITNWETVKTLCEEQPEAARFVGRDRWTALHHACNRRCPHPDVVEALIRANPEALLMEEDKGWLPLHYACRFKAKEAVVRLLLHLDPEKGRAAVFRVDKRGRTPLYYAVRYDAPPGVAGLLLEVDASAVLEEDQDADSPLALVWDAWAEKLDGKRTLQRLYVPTSEEETMTAEERAAYVHKRLRGQIKLFDRWNKVSIFLKAAFGFSVDDDSEAKYSLYGDKKMSVESPTSRERTWRLLHATAAIKCHPSLFLLACALHPAEAFEVDEKDLQPPSHICGGCESASNRTALHFASLSKANGEFGRLVIRQLLSLNPDAAKEVDTEGCLPLHRIVENRDKTDWKADGCNDLYDSNPGAVKVPDTNGLLPLHHAVTAITHHPEVLEESMAERSAICSLIQAYPEAACHSDNLGRLPIHILAQNGISWDIQIQAVHEANPTGVRARSGVKLGNSLPLHFAASNPSAEFSLINRLVQLNPRAASQSNRKGQLPLHLACSAGLSWQSIEQIHLAFPNAVRQSEQGAKKWVALHISAACAKGDKEVLSNLAHLYPEAAGMADSKGRYPLHLACLAGKSWLEGVSEIFDAYPDAIRTPDSVGLLPFHIASFRYSTASTPWTGRIKRPSAIEGGNRRFSQSITVETDQTCAARELEEARKVEVLFHLLKADPTII